MSLLEKQKYYQRGGPDDNLLIEVNPSRQDLREMKDILYVPIEIETSSGLEPRYITLEAFEQLTRSSMGDVIIHYRGREKYVPREKLEVFLMGTEDFILYDH